MNLLCFFLGITLNFVLILSSIDEPLLKMSQNSECIKKIIDDFIKKQTCQKLTESQKTLLAIEMSNCLNTQMGKNLIPRCQDLKKCKIQGDDWNTFTSFFTHIDNLCHFYWDLLHHERTESLIDGLSESAFLAENILNKNYKATQQILSTQSQINSFMEQSLASNRKLSETLTQSEKKLQNMTEDISEFLGQLNQNILTQYSNLVKAMETINKGMEGINSVHSFMMSEISSISGILYFLVEFLALAFVTVFRCFRRNRLETFGILFLNVLVEVILPDWILLFIGIKIIRIFFVLAQIANLFRAFLNKNYQFEELKSQIDGRLSTRRIKRIFKEMMEEAKHSLTQKPE